MKFTLLTALSAFALLPTNMVSAEDSKKLRGPVQVSGQRHGRSSSRTANSDVKIPKFFPTDMTEEQIAIFEEKDTQAQKRQTKRDFRRDTTNSNRGQSEENRERARKTRQSEDRGDSTIDPYAKNGGNRNGNRNGNDDDDDEDGDNDDDGNDDNDFGRRREAKRLAKCENGEGGCDYSTPNGKCYNDCLGFDGLPASACSERCKYIGARCYENCREAGDGIAGCVDECNNAIDGDTRKVANAVDCADTCSDLTPGTRRFERCMDNCTDGDDNGEPNVQR